MAEYISPYDLRRLTLERRRKQAMLEKALRKEEEEKEKAKQNREEQMTLLQMQRESLLQQRRHARVEREDEENVNPDDEGSLFEYDNGLPLDQFEILDEIGLEERDGLFDSTHGEDSLSVRQDIEKAINLSEEIERLDDMLESFRHEDFLESNENDFGQSKENSVYKGQGTDRKRDNVNEKSLQTESNKTDRDENSYNHERNKSVVEDALHNETVRSNKSQRRSLLDDDIVKLEEEIALMEMSTKEQEMDTVQRSEGVKERYSHMHLLDRWKELGKELEEVHRQELSRENEKKGSETVNQIQTETKLKIDSNRLKNPNRLKVFVKDEHKKERQMTQTQNNETISNVKVKTEAEPDRLEKLLKKKEAIEKELREEQLERERKQMNMKREREEKIQQQLKNYQKKKDEEKIEQHKRAETKRERQKQEEKEIMARIERLKMREKDIDRKKKEKEEIHKKSCEELEDQLIEKRLKALKQEEEEIQKRIDNKEEKDDSSKVEKETDVFTKLEKTILGKPYLPSFEGNQFEEWKLEVSCLLKSGLYPDYVIAQLVRNSLKGKTRRVLLTLQPGASSREILRKIESVYGNVRSGDSLIHDFYSAKQSQNESCTDWGIRIETLFYQAVDKGEVEEGRKDRKLKERFWRGIYSERLKNATRVTYESTESFEILRKKARLEEVELDVGKDSKKELINEISEEKSTQPKIHQPIQTLESDRKLDIILEKMKVLEKEVKELKSRQKFEDVENRYSGYNSRSRGRARYRGNYDLRTRYRGRGFRSESYQNRGRNRLEPNHEKSPKEKPEKKQEINDRKEKEKDTEEKSLNM